MSTLDFLYERFGGFESPTDGADVEDGQLFSVFDPVRDRFAALFRAAINQEIAGDPDTVQTGSPWAVARVGTTHAAALPVADTLYQQPTKALLREAKFVYPLLAVYRQTEEHNEHSLYIDKAVCTWGIDYVLGPLTPEDYRKLAGPLVAARRIMQLCVRRRGHPAYESGALQFGEGKGSLMRVRLRRSVEGAAAWGDEEEGQIFYATHIELETEERDDQDSTVFPDFAGASVNVGVGDRDQILPDVIQARTEVELQKPHGVPEPE
jgi:hypothetical protein